MTKIKCSLNSKGKNKCHPQRLARGWRNGWVDAEELADWIAKGYSWSATHFASGHRTAANARGSNAIVFDFDGELQLKDFWSTVTATLWCCLTYTSSSSTPEINRFRAVFLLDSIPLTTAWEHKCVYQFISNKLSDELGITFKDNCGEKPERLWYGNDESQIKLNRSAVVPANVVASIDIPDEPTYKREGSEDVTDLDIERARYVLRNLLRPSEDEEYNSYYLPVMMAAAGIGFSVADAWIDWVSKGHHADKAINLNPDLKWRGINADCGVGPLFGIAKAQDPEWYRKLPDELKHSRRTGTFINQTTILESILAQRMDCCPKNLF